MKKFIKEYLKILSYSIVGLVFIIAGFYLLSNYYHSQEVKKEIYISDNDVYYNSYKEKLNNISDNLKKYSSNINKNNSYEKLYNNLLTCNKVLGEDGTLAKLTTNNFYNSHDIYVLGGNFQSKLLNTCWALHLSYIKNQDNFKEAPYIVNHIKTITNQANNALSELQNNSSYFWSTNVNSNTIRNYLNSDYVIIANSYNEFADIVLALSEKINN